MSDLLTRELAPVDDELQAEVTRARARAARTRRELADVAKALVEAAEGVVEPREDLGISALGRRAERVTLELVDVQTAVEGVRDRLDELADDLERMLVLYTGHVGRVAADVGDHDVVLLVDRLGRRSDLDVEPRLQHELELAVAVGDAEETILARRALHVRESIGARARRSDGP